MSESKSPEEKLLKLIRRKSPGAAAASGVVALKEPKGKEAFEGFFLSKFSLDERVTLWLRMMLMATALFLLAVIVYNIVFFKMQTAQIVSKFGSHVKEVVFPQVTVMQPKPYSYYAQEIQARDIFSSSSEAKKSDENKGPANLSELTRNLRLVGVVLDKTAEAIIEDVDAKQTFFLHEGEQVRDMTIDHIEESKVVLKYNDQKVDLVQ